MTPASPPDKTAVASQNKSRKLQVNSKRDTHGDVLWTWAYPCVSPEERQLFINHCGLNAVNADSSPSSHYVYGQFRRQWFYILTSPVSSLPNLTHVSLVLRAADFHPEKYEALCNILLRTYMRSGSPISLLEQYLSVITRGQCNGEENGVYATSSFSKKHALTTGSLRDVVGRFGLEVILLYTAILLKKKVVVYHADPQELLTFIRILPAMAWHRLDWGVLLPLMHTTPAEISDLTSRRYYIAGFTDASVESRQDLYDVFVNLGTNEIVVSPRAKEYMGLGKLHKDLATFLVREAEDSDVDDHQIIKDLAVKTRELLNNLRSLGEEGEGGCPLITMDTLRQRKMPPVTENFLFNLAASEGWVYT